jgi:hypothetical protein
MPHFTPLVEDTNINALEINQRFQELSNALNQVLAGGLAQTSPDIDDFTNAVHNHNNPAAGGQLTVAAIDSEAATDGQVAASDGAGGVEWIDPIDSFLELVDAISSYAGRGGELLRVNSLATGIESVGFETDQYVLDETSDYTTTSTTFVAVDATKLALSVDTDGEAILVGFSATVNNATNASTINLELEVDGNIHATDDGIVMTQFVTGVGKAAIGFSRYIPLAAGTHTIKLLWRVSAGTGIIYAGAGTSTLDLHPQLFVMGVLG